ncbi:MAG: MarR family transcriptional regulator [Bifidobacteriaceae bacterium]|nr:MarR family transcriptional regulator [Bifidobacteriaceae bacterium]
MTYYDEMAYKFEDIRQYYRKMFLEHIEQSNRGEFQVLYILRNEIANVPSEIAKITKITPGRVSAILASLEKKGYITRTTNPKNRRQVFVTLSEEGRKFAQKHSDEAHECMRWTFEKMGKQASADFLVNLEAFLTICITRLNSDELPDDQMLKEVLKERGIPFSIAQQ